VVPSSANPRSLQLLPQNWRSIAQLKFLLITSLRHALHEAYAAVPAQQSIVIALWPDLFSFSETFHRLLKTGQHAVRMVSGAHLGLGVAFVKNAQVIAALIITREFFETCLRVPHAV